MKPFILLLLTVTLSFAAKIEVMDSTCVMIDGIKAGCLHDVLANNPTLSDEIRAAFVVHVQVLAETNPMKAVTLVSVCNKEKIELDVDCHKKIDDALTKQAEDEAQAIEDAKPENIKAKRDADRAVHELLNADVKPQP